MERKMSFRAPGNELTDRYSVCPFVNSG